MTHKPKGLLLSTQVYMCATRPTAHPKRTMAAKLNYVSMAANFHSDGLQLIRIHFQGIAHHPNTSLLLKL